MALVRSAACPPGTTARHRLPRAPRRLGHARRPRVVEPHHLRSGRIRSVPRLGRAPRSAGDRADLRHPLRHRLDQARHPLEGRAGLSPARGSWKSCPRPGMWSSTPRAAGPPTSRSKSCCATTCWSPTSTRAGPSPPSTAAPCACWCPGCTSGRAPSGCRGIEFTADERLGYWERLGYHALGDPWLEQRYS